MGSCEKPYEYYPEPKEIDAWIDKVWATGHGKAGKGDLLPNNGWANDFGDYQARTQLVRFEYEGLPVFFGVWQAAISGPAPLVVHLPGYGGELSVHPPMAACGFNVLNLSPLGYWTPNGFDESKRDRETLSWPVLMDTLRSNREHGYMDWLQCVICAVEWAWNQKSVLPDRVSFYGCSQGGGTSILAGSLFRDHGIRCIAADEPFLTDYPLADLRGAYSILTFAVQAEKSREGAYRKLAVVDTLAHTHRIHCPIVITTGTADTVCPPETVYKLDSRMDGTHAMITFEGRPHGYAFEFARLAETWMKLYA